METSLLWLPASPEWRNQLRNLPEGDSKAVWSALIALANSRLDFVQTSALDKAMRKHFSAGNQPPAAAAPVRLAILASSTIDHLLPAIRVAALRRGIWCETYTGEYGQYLQELLDPESALGKFKPTAILVALDSHHLAAGDARQDQPDRVDLSLQLLKKVWSAASSRFGCPIIQQTLLPVFDPLLGNNEQRLSSSPRAVVSQINSKLRACSDEFGVHILALDQLCMEHGLRSWHDISLWHHAKQEICLAAAPLYGDQVGRILAALQGRSYKCLVLDLDNTLWGGVIGDDGLSGIRLGQNSALGEAFIQFQRYALQLSRRGIILAVCSKNDHANAISPFEQHSEMLLKMSDIACFKANWQDKASNIRSIAKTLNIGLDSIVFVDDNPFERNQVRSELPMVAVPEIPEDPALYSATISAAGYFEGIHLTAEDAARTAQYQENAKRTELLECASDLDSYLKSLKMQLLVEQLDPSNIQRATQLINKTNQFNLTTRRYTEQEVTKFAADPACLALQFRLLDSFGDNGVICVIIGRKQDGDLLLDTWLMSCRVLGRQVEQSTLNVIASHALSMGAANLLGHYIPTAKNSMVKDLYQTLGFEKVSESTDGSTTWRLPLQNFATLPTHIQEEYSYAALTH